MPKGSAYRTTPRGRRGRFARAEMTEREALSVGTAARIRIHGVAPEYAHLPSSGTVYGRMRDRRELTHDQYEAAVWYLNRRGAYLKAIQAPRDEGKAGAGPGAHGEDTGDYADWCKSVCARWAEIMTVIREVSVETRTPILAAFDTLLVRDVEVPHLVTDLRTGLNAIHRVFLRGKK